MKRNKLYLMGILLAGAFLISCTGNGRNGTSDEAKDESIISSTLETTLAAKVESDNVGSETITGNEDDKSVETSAEEKTKAVSETEPEESSETENKTTAETKTDIADDTKSEAKLSDVSSQSKSDGKLSESSESESETNSSDSDALSKAESETVMKDDGSGETVADAAESTAAETKAPETEAAKSGKTKKKKKTSSAPKANQDSCVGDGLLY